MNTPAPTKEEQVETYPEIYKDKRPFRRYALIVLAILALIVLSAIAGAAIADDTNKINELNKQNKALQTKVDDTITQRDDAKEEAAQYETDAGYVDNCRTAGKALARAGVKRNDLIVKILESNGATGIDEISASNDEFSAAVAQLKLCDPDLSPADIGL